MGKYKEENVWERPIWLYCMPCKPWELGSYELKRIIDADGNRIQPAFDDMVASLRNMPDNKGVKVKGLNYKPLKQIVNGNDWDGNVKNNCCCLFGGAAARTNDSYQCM